MWLCWRSTVRGSVVIPSLILPRRLWAVRLVRELRHLGVPHFGGTCTPNLGCKSLQSFSLGQLQCFVQTDLAQLHDHKQRDNNSRALSIKFGIVIQFFLLSLHTLFINHRFSSHSSSTDSIINPLSPKRYANAHGKYYIQ
jgi:hypothetical protein